MDLIEPLTQHLKEIQFQNKMTIKKDQLKNKMTSTIKTITTMKTTLKMETSSIVWYIVYYLKKGAYETLSHTTEPYYCLQVLVFDTTQNT